MILGWVTVLSRFSGDLNLIVGLVYSAEADSWDKGLPSDSQKEGCTFCEDQEEQRCCEVQG